MIPVRIETKEDMGGEKQNGSGWVQVRKKRPRLLKKKSSGEVPKMANKWYFLGKGGLSNILNRLRNGQHRQKNGGGYSDYEIGDGKENLGFTNGGNKK